MEGKILLEGLCFGEGPRWHDGALWLSDMHARQVLRVDGDGNPAVVVELADDEPQDAQEAAARNREDHR